MFQVQNLSNMNSELKKKTKQIKSQPFSMFLVLQYSSPPFSKKCNFFEAQHLKFNFSNQSSCTEYKYSINEYQLCYIHPVCQLYIRNQLFCCKLSRCPRASFQQHRRARKLKVIFPPLPFQFERIKDEGFAVLLPAVSLN